MKFKLFVFNFIYFFLIRHDIRIYGVGIIILLHFY